MEPGLRAAEPSDAPVAGASCAGTVSVADLEPHDAVLIRRIDGALSKAGLRTIHPRAVIDVGDLAALREIVNEAERRVDLADEEFLDVCESVIDPLRRDLLARLARGETAGLPLMGPQNPLKRLHPYEAITQVSYGGSNYVLRVGPWNAPALASKGQMFQQAVDARLRDYQSMIVPMFH